MQMSEEEQVSLKSKFMHEQLQSQITKDYPQWERLGPMVKNCKRRREHEKQVEETDPAKILI